MSNIALTLNKIPKVAIVKRIPDIEIISTSSFGKLYCVKYFVGNKRPLDRILRITSKQPDFKNIFSVDLFTLDGTAKAGIELSKQMPDDVFITFVSDLITPPSPNRDTLEEQIDIMSLMNSVGTSGLGSGVAKTAVKGEWKQKIKSFAVNNPDIAALIAIYGLVIVATLFFKYRYYFKKGINWLKEKYVTGPLEQKINEELFSGQQKDEPAFAMFLNLNRYITHITSGKAVALIICGPPGMSKTYSLRRALYFEGLKPGSDYVIEKGSSLTLGDTYSLLYMNRKKILILDDFDTPLKNEEMVNMLKAITDTYSRRILSMPREKTTGNVETEVAPAAPSKFEFKGKLIIISNLWRKDISPALVSRAPVFEVNFDSKTIIKALEELIKYTHLKVDVDTKMEVLAYLEELYRKDKSVTVDFRSFKTALDARVGSPDDWKDMTKIILNYKGK